MALDFATDVELHSFHWTNFNREVLAAHKRVMQHFNLNVQYTEANVPHGEWLDWVMGRAQCKIVGIIEPDLIPLSRQIVLNSINLAYQMNSFVGCAQVSNHIPPAAHIFASPAFFFISTDCYQRMGKPSFLEMGRADVAEEVSYRAEEMGIHYRTLFPTHFEREPLEGIWRLSSYGYYGIGTVFGNQVYHLFQSRYDTNADLFIQRCDDVVNNRFSMEGFRPSI